MKFIKIIFITICLSFLNINGAEQTSMPFRVGFEFQMDGRLCEWALHDYNLQKKPIFTIEDENNKLCHVELDGPDIEFVTEPFSNQEKHRFTTCMKGIKVVIDVTESRLNSTPSINFRDWLDALSTIKTVQIIPTPFFDTIKEQIIKKLNPNALWHPSWQPQMTVQHPLQSTIALCHALFKDTPVEPLIKASTPTNIPSNTALAGLMFLVAHEMQGMTNSYLWPIPPNHLLDLSIALTMYFHNKDLSNPDWLELSINALSDPELKKLEEHHLMRSAINALFEKDENKQQDFLSKLPMKDPFIVRMLGAISNIGTFIKIADNPLMHKAILMRDTFVSFSSVHQFDAKRWTNFMSRRPFSHMFREICDENDSMVVSDHVSRSTLETSSFLEIFNQNIFFADELPKGFHLANYAEQFFDDSERPLNLEGLLGFFSPMIRNSVFLRNLLSCGILSTTMFTVMAIDEIVPDSLITPLAKETIREMLVEEYTSTVLNSVAQPKKRNILHVTKEGASIKIDVKPLAGDSSLDLLSPPFLLDDSDSMGRYREGVFHMKYNPKTFGSSIVEFRNIQQAKQLKANGNIFAQSRLLTLPDFIEEEALNVFNVMCSLTIKQ